MARHPDPSGRPRQTNQRTRPPGHQGGQQGPVFKEISWLQRWPRLVSAGFVLLVLIEILIFLWVAEHIGFALTLLAVIGSAVIGLWLIHRTGLDMVGKLRLTLAQGREPGHSLVDGACFVIAGLLLIMPGFFSDLIAILLMLPVTRDWLIRRFASKIVGDVVTSPSKQRGRVITDVEFHEIEETISTIHDDPLDQPFTTAASKVPEQASPTASASATDDGEMTAAAAEAPPSENPDRLDMDESIEEEVTTKESVVEIIDQGHRPTPLDEDDDRWTRPLRRPIIDVEES